MTSAGQIPVLQSKSERPNPARHRWSCYLQPVAWALHFAKWILQANMFLDWKSSERTEFHGLTASPIIKELINHWIDKIRSQRQQYLSHNDKNAADCNLRLRGIPQSANSHTLHSQVFASIIKALTSSPNQGACQSTNSRSFCVDLLLSQPRLVQPKPKGVTSGWETGET